MASRLTKYVRDAKKPSLMATNVSNGVTAFLLALNAEETDPAMTRFS
jgi:hypothetical protein